MKRFEKELPNGYVEAFCIDAKDKKTVIRMNLLFFAVFLVSGAICSLLPLVTNVGFRQTRYSEYMRLISAIAFVAYLIYIVLHELTHGAAYRWLTGEKLTYGLTLSVAFCGVPHIYVSRRVSLIASAAPLVVFSLLFGATMVILLFVDTALYIVAAILFCMHLGGCVGDLWVILTLLFRCKDASTLVKDTGPKQIFYIKRETEQ